MKILQKETAKIFVFNENIVSGYEMYEIAAKLYIPIKRIDIPFNSYNEAIAWICRTQLKRNDLMLLMRKYLIGRRSLAELRGVKEAAENFLVHIMEVL